MHVMSEKGPFSNLFEAVVSATGEPEFGEPEVTDHGLVPLPGDPTEPDGLPAGSVEQSREPYAALELTITGPPGAGKTHLAAQLSRFLSQEGYVVEHVDDTEGVQSYLPVDIEQRRPGQRVKISSAPESEDS